MFEAFGGVPEGWEPIPDEVRAEVGDWDEIDPPPAGMRALDADDFVWQAVANAVRPESLSLLTAVPFEAMSEAARSHALRRLEEVSAHLEAVKAQLVGVIAGPAPATEAERREDFSPNEIGVAAKCSVYAADGKITFARALATRLQATARAMGEGHITLAQAEMLVEETAHLEVEVAREIEAKLLVFSHRQDRTNFRKSLRRWLEKLDPNFTKRAKEARRDVRVCHTPLGDGVGELYIRGPLEHTTAIATALNAHAQTTKAAEGGTADERKLAGLRDMIARYLGSPGAAKLHGRLPTVNVTIDFATLLKLREGIAEIVGVGGIPADVARWLLADGAPLRRFVIDPHNGQLLDHGTETYTVPPWLAEYLIGRNPASAAPHSNVPSAGCDMEHNLPHGKGGRTDRINATPMDRRWHRAKTHADWTYQKDRETGVITWTSPVSGLTCEINPYDYRAGP